MEIKTENGVTIEMTCDLLWREMMKEINRNGYSDLTLALEGVVYDIRELSHLYDKEIDELKKTNQSKGGE